MKERIILGIDPGTMRMGFGLIREIGQVIESLSYGVWQLKEHKTQMVRMRYIYKHMMTLLHAYAPDELAIESVFYGANVQSMLKLGRAQGIAIAAALACDMPVIEYAPRKVKQAVTGHGNASKTQVSVMVGNRLGITIPPTLLDASDALAVAICHSQQRLSPTAGGKSWSQFAADHPQRVATQLP